MASCMSVFLSADLDVLKSYLQNRRPRWWIVLGDEKSNRVVVPPMQISDLPFLDPRKPRNFRAFRLQFQAPQGVGLYTWRIRLISDTFIGEDFAKDLTVSIIKLACARVDGSGRSSKLKIYPN